MPLGGVSTQPEDQPVGMLEPVGDAPTIRHPNMNHTIPAPHGGASRAVLALALAGSLSFAAAEESFELPETELTPATVSAHGDMAVPYDQTGVSVTVLDVPELKKEGICTLTF